MLPLICLWYYVIYYCTIKIPLQIYSYQISSTNILIPDLRLLLLWSSLLFRLRYLWLAIDDLDCLPSFSLEDVVDVEVILKRFINDLGLEWMLQDLVSCLMASTLFSTRVFSKASSRATSMHVLPDRTHRSSVETALSSISIT